MRRSVGIWAILLVFEAVCQGAAPAVPSVSIPFREGEITIDGVAGDPGWSHAAKIELSAEPLNRQVPSTVSNPTTSVLLTYDSNYLYVAFLCEDEHVITVGEKHDDALHAGDAVETFIDGIGDHRQFFEIQQNAAGLVRDVNYLYTGFSNAPDENGYLTDWNNIWDDSSYNIRRLRFAGRKSADGSGWITELAIPASELLRRNGKRELAPGMTLRANFVRLECGTGNETVAISWSPTVFGRPHRSPGRMGYLKLLSGKQPDR